MYNWIAKTFVYSLCNATMGLSKKKSLQTATEWSYLLGYSLFALLLVMPFFRYAKTLDSYAIKLMFIKALAIFIGWNCALRGIQKVTLSVYGAMDSVKLIFSHALAIIFLGERLTLPIIIGSIVIIVGIQLFSSKKDDGGMKSSRSAICLLLVNALANALCGTIDKTVAGHGDPLGLLFYFIWFASMFCVIGWAFSKNKQGLITICKNGWIWLGTVSFLFGDLNLYYANLEPASSAMVIAIIKTASLIFLIIFSLLFFKEKKIWYNLGAALLIILGISITTLF